jgi:hypothetical protein
MSAYFGQSSCALSQGTTPHPIAASRRPTDTTSHPAAVPRHLAGAFSPVAALRHSASSLFLHVLSPDERFLRAGGRESALCSRFCRPMAEIARCAVCDGRRPSDGICARAPDLEFCERVRRRRNRFARFGPIRCCISAHLCHRPEKSTAQRHICASPARSSGGRAMRQARYAAAALPDVRRRPVTWRPICRCAPACLARKVHRGPHEPSCGAGMRAGVIQLRPASTKVYWARVWPLILKAPCLPVREAERFQRYERGRERRRIYGRLVPQLTQKLPSFSVPHAGQCQVRLGVNAGGTGGAGACCCAVAAGASGAGAGF